MIKEHSSSPSEFTQKYRDYEIETMPLSQIFKTHSIKDIQFLKVDVEGYEYEVLEGNDWEQYRPEVLCIEANHVLKDWRPLLRSQGYEKAFFDGLNEYYMDIAISKSLNFSYVSAVINKEPIVNYRLLNELDQNETEIRNLERENTRKEEHIKYIEHLLNNAKHDLEEISTVGKHLRKQTVANASRVKRRVFKKPEQR